MLSHFKQKFRIWLFRPKIDQGTVTLTQRRIFILPTKQGLVLGGVLILMLLGDINYVLSLGYVLTFLLAMMAVMSMLHAFRNLAHLQIRAGRVDAVFCGEPAQFMLHFDNPSTLVRHQLWLRDLQGNKVSFDLPAQQVSQVAFSLPTHQRGWVQTGRLSLYTTFPLGLFHAWSYLHFDTQGLVYPKPLPFAPLPVSLAFNEAGKNHVAGEDEFAGLRAYTPGDALPRIAWKAFAREQGLQVKQFSTPVGAALLFDYLHTPERDVEAKLSHLTRWVLDAEAQGLRYGLRLLGSELPADHGVAHRDLCLQQLALFNPPSTMTQKAQP
ncbi:MAG: DUF58 domain-containing protein [Gallionella sp.]|nr:DUF58 domain-containing protein [Gallionella sp.]MDD4959228.1 DUF58 domain-containing protein [Gallionella sp.]